MREEYDSGIDVKLFRHLPCGSGRLEIMLARRKMDLPLHISHNEISFDWHLFSILSEYNLRKFPSVSSFVIVSDIL
jgi:hypothetical protein